jgi:hypothetical protein
LTVVFGNRLENVTSGFVDLRGDIPVVHVDRIGEDAIMKRHRGAVTLVAVASIAALASVLPAGSPEAQTPGRMVKITGEVVDTFCTVSEIMFASGTAHYQCAVWCAVGGVPVSVKANDGEIYMVLRIEEDDSSAANPRMIRIQGSEVTAEGELFERDGVKYLLVTRVADEKGVIKLTHEEHGIQPFGQ